MNAADYMAVLVHRGTTLGRLQTFFMGRSLQTERSNLSHNPVPVPFLLADDFPFNFDPIWPPVCRASPRVGDVSSREKRSHIRRGFDCVVKGGWPPGPGSLRRLDTN